MHELSLCESIVETLEQQALAQHCRLVKTVWLEIGALSGVEAEALRFCFDAVTRGTLAEQAKLVILEVPGQAWCTQCSIHVPMQQRFDACPRCGGFQLRVNDGEQLRIKELEVE